MFNFEQLRLRQTLSCYCSRRPPMCGTELSALPHSSALRQPRTPAVWRPSWRPGRTRTWACTSWASRPSTAPPPTMPPRTWSCCCSAGQRPTAWCSSGIIIILIPYPVQCTRMNCRTHIVLIWIRSSSLKRYAVRYKLYSIQYVEKISIIYHSIMFSITPQEIHLAF